MNIPLDNLYHFVEGITNKSAVFYLFLPHGSRKILDLQMLRSYPEQQRLTAPRIICHDQEPLDFYNYTDDKQEMQICAQNVNQQFKDKCGIEDWLLIKNNNLKLGTFVYAGIDIRDQAVLLHSELNSLDLQMYEKNGYVGAYWWSHAIIARDWYRYAQVDPDLYHTRHPHVPFLIYSRGFTREREYRLKFIELLVKNDLVNCSTISMLHQEDGQPVYSYEYQDRQFTVNDPYIFDKIPECQALASASATYDSHDVVNSYINIVLETQFNGSKLHLTEKILRPIACGQPFMLAAAPGALALLRYYGFETYHKLIDESYDLENDPVKRLEKIVAAMQKLKSQTTQQWSEWWKQAQSIALYNQKHFFSNEFYSQIVNQLRFNLANALAQVDNTKGKHWRENRKLLRQLKPHNWKTALSLPNDLIKLSELLSLRKIRS
jgi:hypothetical protein